MQLSVWFWLCLFLFALGYGWNAYQPTQNRALTIGSGVLLFLALLILGIQVFGGPVK